MKNLHTLSAIVVLAGLTLVGCVPSQQDEAGAGPAASIIESSGYVGLWQKTQQVEVLDVDTELTITTEQLTNLFKCILPDGSYFMFRATPNGEPRSVDSRIELYGTYVLTGDTLCTETIVTNCAKPELSGLSSDVHYNLPDKDVMNVYYNLRNADGSAGSSEFTPEVWRRVPTTR